MKCPSGPCTLNRDCLLQGQNRQRDAKFPGIKFDVDAVRFYRFGKLNESEKLSPIIIGSGANRHCVRANMDDDGLRINSVQLRLDNEIIIDSSEGGVGL